MRVDFLYPREGTETRILERCHLSGLIFFIPARGRKPYGRARLCLVMMIFFIPARGRKPADFEHVTFVHGDFLYPREGTETAAARCPLAFWSRFSLSPRGDGNSSFSQSASCCCQIFFIPARGRHSQQKSTFLPSVYLQTVRNVLN